MDEIDIEKAVRGFGETAEEDRPLYVEGWYDQQIQRGVPLNTLKAWTTQIRKRMLALGYNHVSIRLFRLAPQYQYKLMLDGRNRITERLTNQEALPPYELYLKEFGSFLDAGSVIDRGIAVIALTGRRVCEVFGLGRFRPAVDGREGWLDFCGQAKKSKTQFGGKSARKDETSLWYTIPCLKATTKVFRASKEVSEAYRGVIGVPGGLTFEEHALWVREHSLEKAKQIEKIHSMISVRANRFFKRMPAWLPAPRCSRSLRQLYAAYACCNCKPDGMAPILFYNDILGHTKLDFKTSAQYMSFTV